MVVNVSECKWPIVSHVVKKMLGWKTSEEPESMNWDLFWTDHSVKPEFLSKMESHQKINHFPGTYNFSRKDHLARNLKRLKKEFPQFYKFFPETWNIPSERGDFQKKFAQRKHKIQTFIVKPEAAAQGRGIFLCQKPDDIPSNESYVVQKYLDRPYLIDGLKFDLRIYVLLAGVDPLRIFIYEEGLARFSTEEYKMPNKKNIEDLFMHLTNYSINKNSLKFQANTDSENANVGHKRSLKSIWEHMRAKGENVEKLWEEIKRMVIKTVCPVQPIIAHLYKCSQPEEFYQHMCFEVLGFDFIIDHKLKPRILEVNHSPSFGIDSPFDEDVKSKVICDTLRLMNLTQKMKKKVMLAKKKELEKRVLTGKRPKLTVEEKALIHSECQKERDQWIYNHLGGWEVVYPFQDKSLEKEPYDEIIETSRDLYRKSTGVDRKIVKKGDVSRIISQPSPSKFLPKNVMPSVENTNQIPVSATPAGQNIVINNKSRSSNFKPPENPKLK